MLLASAVLVFGTVAWFVMNLATGADLVPGYQHMISRIPWLALAAVWIGGALGLASLFRQRRWFHIPVVGLEVVLVTLLSVYVLELSWLPESELRLGVGDTFPAYALQDQDGTVRSHEPGTPRGPALYIFYRGDW